MKFRCGKSLGQWWYGLSSHLKRQQIGTKENFKSSEKQEIIEFFSKRMIHVWIPAKLDRDNHTIDKLTAKGREAKKTSENSRTIPDRNRNCLVQGRRQDFAKGGADASTKCRRHYGQRSGGRWRSGGCQSLWPHVLGMTGLTSFLFWFLFSLSSLFLSSSPLSLFSSLSSPPPAYAPGNRIFSRIGS